uniref:Uncharacterized protein n=1 Tax=Chromera velia CCMP2878 TaxID=1169474 RepID=A0A0G4HMI3_9ALVE|eukprot:Cvel_7482.t1-p1 / transcript=Cvel_7482.t1 / gene=Cvel_7482 / organism=Chromera_velia_CCMP2878 / gene_product=hypothetical protein / transcript_product=hypothetical protein / location=Cvel_scaffold392:27996-30480(+) / protein_length=793 / sequence_SO=supercontig / SO=protein_coding / is_pseudo=false
MKTVAMTTQNGLSFVSLVFIHPFSLLHSSRTAPSPLLKPVDLSFSWLSERLDAFHPVPGDPEGRELLWAIDGMPCYDVEGRYPLEVVRQTSSKYGLFDAPCGRDKSVLPLVTEWGYQFHHGQDFPGPCQKYTEWGRQTPSGSREESLSRLRDYYLCSLSLQTDGMNAETETENGEGDGEGESGASVHVTRRLRPFQQPSSNEFQKAVTSEGHFLRASSRALEKIVGASGSPSPYNMIGHYFYGHYGCFFFPCGIVASEIGENISSIEAHIAFTRGAARQFGKPWGLQFSTWYVGKILDYTEEGASAWGDAGSPSGLGGHSLSLYRRGYWSAFMSGAGLLIAEAGAVNWFLPGVENQGEADKVKLDEVDNRVIVLSEGGDSDVKDEKSDGLLRLSPLGEIGREFAEVTKDPVHGNRGIPYVPVGILLEKQHGMGLGWWNDELSFDKFSLTEGEKSVRSLFETVWPKESLKAEARGVHNETFFMRGSRYGEIFDVLLPSELEEKSVKSYRVLLLAGDFVDPFKLIGAKVDRERVKTVRTSGVRRQGGRGEWRQKGPVDVEVFDVSFEEEIGGGGASAESAFLLLPPEGKDGKSGQSSWWPLWMGGGLFGLVGGWAESWVGGWTLGWLVGGGQAHAGEAGEVPIGNLKPYNGSKGGVLTFLNSRSSSMEALGLWSVVLDTLMKEKIFPFRISDPESGDESMAGRVEALVNVHLGGFNLTVINNFGAVKTPSTGEEIDEREGKRVRVRLEEEFGEVRGVTLTRERGRPVPLEEDGRSFVLQVPAGDVVVLGVQVTGT